MRLSKPRSAGWRTKFGRDERGIAAIEFALIVPILLVMLAGAVDYGQAFEANRKLNQISYKVADVISQSREWDTGQVDNILAGAQTMILPLGTDGLGIVLTVVDVDSAGTESVSWSRSVGATAHTAGNPSPVTIPVEMKENDVQLVIVETSYVLVTPFASLIEKITGRASYAFSEHYILYPRQGDTISLI